jgi:hypothetical protein
MCGTPTNHRGAYSSGEDGALQQVNQYPRCGYVELRAMVEPAVR